MSLVKKLREDWFPSENTDLKVGETIDITDYRALVESGVAVLVDEQGNELPLPGEAFRCPVCQAERDNIDEFVNHTMTHKKPESVVAPEVLEEPVVVSSSEDTIRAKRLAALEKARQVRKENLSKKGK